jgi:hypothetical protein
MTNNKEVPVEEEEEQRWVALGIRAARIRNGVEEYRVRWETDPPCKDTWETEADLNCPVLIDDWRKSREARKKKRRRA